MNKMDKNYDVVNVSTEDIELSEVGKCVVSDKSKPYLKFYKVGDKVTASIKIINGVNHLTFIKKADGIVNTPAPQEQPKQIEVTEVKNVSIFLDGAMGQEIVSKQLEINNMPTAKVVATQIFPAGIKDVNGTEVRLYDAFIYFIEKV